MQVSTLCPEKRPTVYRQ